MMRTHTSLEGCINVGHIADSIYMPDCGWILRSQAYSKETHWLAPVLGINKESDRILRTCRPHPSHASDQAKDRKAVELHILVSKSAIVPADPARK